MTIKERIFYYLEKKNIKKEAFYKKTELPASSFKGEGFKYDLGITKIVRILQEYPELDHENLQWFIKGEGELKLKDHEDEKKPENPQIDNREFEKIIDLLLNLFAQNNAADKNFLFLQNQIKNQSLKIDEILASMQQKAQKV
ncbi:hypothetical protein VUJ46_16400 [Chryseobacterium sp. MYb264]|uniref:hypothetical protein n=1 Tax=Chryseobacterium sp. MYb264 TaxID=2745153 RepID=UPI002E0F626B|nr:hypothetical protein VUJ46_16400 [Chryseobacterium sp. MYb264]